MKVYNFLVEFIDETKIPIQVTDHDYGSSEQMQPNEVWALAVFRAHRYNSTINSIELLECR